MPTLQDLRQSMPELDGLDDANAVDFLQAAYYPNVDRAKVAAAVGYKEPPPPVPQASLMDRAKDVGIAALRGAIDVPEAAVGLADIPTGGRVGKFLENEGGTIGFRPKQAKEFADQYLSPAQKATNAGFADQKGVVDTALYALTHPSLIVQGGVESLPSMGAGGVIGRGAMWAGLSVADRAAVMALPQAERAAAVANLSRVAGPVAAGIGEGGISAGQTAEQVREETKDGLLTGTQSLISATSGAITGGLTALGGRIANKLGIGDLDQLLAGVQRASPAAQKGFVRKVIEGAVSEGLLEELPQSVQEQVAQNMALGKPLDEGVAQAGVLGAMIGAALGGPSAMLHGHAPAPAPTPPTNPIDPATPAAMHAQADAAFAGIGAAPTVDAAIDAFNNSQLPLVPPSAPDAVGAMARMAAAPLDSATAADVPETGPAQAESFASRLADVRTQLQDSRVRQRIRDASGPTALDDVLYYAQQADNDRLPGKTSDRMLEFAERLLARAQMTVLPGGLGQGVNVYIADNPNTTPQIGLDTAPTGRIRVDSAGSAAPEVRADVISDADARRAVIPVDSSGMARPSRPIVPGAAAPLPTAAQPPTASPSTSATAALPRFYTISNAINEDGPLQVQVMRDGRGNVAIMTDGHGVIDVTNMVKAGMSIEEAIARTLGDHPEGSPPDVSKVTPVTAAPSRPSLGDQVRAFALKTQRDAGWNPDWPFVPADLGNADFREHISNDPGLSSDEKAAIFAAGKKLGVVPQSESVATPVQASSQASSQTPDASTTPGSGDQESPPPADLSGVAVGQRIAAATKTGVPLQGEFNGFTNDGRVKVRTGSNVHYVDRSTVQLLDANGNPVQNAPASQVQASPQSANPAPQGTDTTTAAGATSANTGTGATPGLGKPETPQGAFTSADEAEAYISTQRRAASAKLPPALPLQMPDGSFGIATADQPTWQTALRQELERAANATPSPQAAPAKSQGPAGPEQRTESTRQTVELRKRASVLRSLLECIG